MRVADPATRACTISNAQARSEPCTAGSAAHLFNHHTPRTGLGTGVGRYCTGEVVSLGCEQHVPVAVLGGQRSLQRGG